MKKILPYCFLIWALTVVTPPIYGQGVNPELILLAEDITAFENGNQITFPDPETLFDSLPQPEVNEKIVNLSFVPRIFVGYRKIHGVPEYSKRSFYRGLKDMKVINGNDLVSTEEILVDSIMPMNLADSLRLTTIDVKPCILVYQRPQWFEDALHSRSSQEDLHYSYMIDNPMAIQYAYWDLPEPPVLLEEDRSFLAFLRKQEVPEIDPTDAVLPEVEIKKKHWLHSLNTMLQFSQAYISPNWYQGGNNYLSLLFGFNWKVELNQVYHPNLLFQSDLSYKLAFTSNPKGSYHKYTISDDIFQYNLNAGVKAAKDWYYSLNLQFKTQLLNNYATDSDVRTASILSPGDLNIGLGMSYNHKNKLGTFQYTLTISPLSYNLKTCIESNNIISHEQFNIEPWKRSKSEIGSNVEFNMDWKITTNISYKTRLFMFSNYKYFLGDWQNTFSFDINKFLSTQIFVNLRYDGSAENYGKWKKFMMKELLSFGLSYTFSTKP